MESKESDVLEMQARVKVQAQKTKKKRTRRKKNRSIDIQPPIPADPNRIICPKCSWPMWKDGFKIRLGDGFKAQNYKCPNGHKHAPDLKGRAGRPNEILKAKKERKARIEKERVERAKMEKERLEKEGFKKERFQE